MLQYKGINLFSNGLHTDESRENYREAICKVMRQLLRKCFIQDSYPKVLEWQGLSLFSCYILKMFWFDTNRTDKYETIENIPPKFLDKQKYSNSWNLKLNYS